MNLGLAAATFALVIPAELPDKTFISALVLGTRYRSLPVWIGAASGLILQAGIAVAAGGLLSLLPHRVVEVIVAALFFGGAFYLLWVPEKQAVARGTEFAIEEETLLEGDTPNASGASPPSGIRITVTTFGIVAIAEFGDLTQVLIANLSARYRDPLSVFVGAVFAFIVISGVAVFAGRVITRVVPLAIVRKVSGVALGVLGILTAVSAAR